MHQSELAEKADKTVFKLLNTLEISERYNSLHKRLEHNYSMVELEEKGGGERWRSGKRER